MKAVTTLSLMFGLAILSVAEDKKPEAKFDAEKFVGKWKLTGGKKSGTAIEDDAKKGWYDISKDKIKIMADGKEQFVIEYTVDAKKSPVEIDMKITEASFAEAKGMKSKGILEVNGDEFKLCYYPMEDKRPVKFDDDKAFSFAFKREKDEKKK